MGDVLARVEGGIGVQQIACNVTVDSCGREAEPTRAPIISVSLLEMSSISMQ